MRIVLTLLTFFVFVCARAQEMYLLVGTYDSPKSEGIYVYRFNTSTGASSYVSHIKTPNPSFIAVSPTGNFVYAVHELAPADGTGGEVAAFSFDKKSGTLRLINKVPSYGDHPCHVELDKTGKWLFVANYTSGSLSVYNIMPDGSIGKVTDTIRHKGSGPHPTRQKSPHVHGNKVTPDNKYVLTTDLGIDRVMIYKFDASDPNMKLKRVDSVNSTAGSGPRLLTFHPNGKIVYVIEELSGHVSVYSYKKGKLKEMQRLSTQSKGDTLAPNSADVQISLFGEYLYASNRGKLNTLAMYKVKATGLLEAHAYIPVIGQTPRNFTIDPTGKFLLVGCQNTDEIIVFDATRDLLGLLRMKTRIPVGKPVCLKWVSME